MVDGLIRRQSHPQGVRRGVPGSIAATLPQTEDPRQRVGAAAPHLLISVFCLLSSALCCAEDLPDPPRPPAMIAGTSAVTGRWSAVSRSSGLQSTIISESRRAAIIDGKTVELWGKHGNARLVEVNEGSVVLQTAQTRRILTLFPDVKMTKAKIPDPNKTKAE